MWGCTAVNWIKKFSILGSAAIAWLAIAQSASARFVIFVAGNDAATLQRVRTISPTAFATKINDQSVIQAGTFNSEISADSLAIALQQSGLSAQKYFKASGGKESNVQVPFSDTSSVTPLTTPQQVIIQPAALTQQPVAFSEASSQLVNSVTQQSIFSQQSILPQQSIAYTNTVVPQVQTQQVLVPRWQQVLVPETRQVVTQVVPQTQIVQPSYIQSASIQSNAYVQPNTYVQPQSGFIQAASVQPNTYVQPQSGFIEPTATLAPTSYNSIGSSNEQLLPQQSQNTNFRYVAAVPANLNNQFLLSRVRQYVTNAFFSNSGRGTYIHAGAYQSRDSAESVSRYLRSQGVDSRVLYF